jgi:hypothetical protein
MNDLKTPVSRLLRLVRSARERWKAKALERQKRLRAAQVRIRDLERSRAYWKARALSAEGRVPARDASGTRGDEDGGEEPPAAPVPTRVANHRYSLEAMQLSLRCICMPASVVAGSVGSCACWRVSAAGRSRLRPPS